MKFSRKRWVFCTFAFSLVCRNYSGEEEGSEKGRRKKEHVLPLHPAFPQAHTWPAATKSGFNTSIALSPQPWQWPQTHDSNTPLSQGTLRDSLPQPPSPGGSQNHNPLPAAPAPSPHSNIQHSQALGCPQSQPLAGPPCPLADHSTPRAGRTIPADPSPSSPCPSSPAHYFRFCPSFRVLLHP